MHDRRAAAAAVGVTAALAPASAFAGEVANQFDANSWLALAAAIVVGIAALGGTLAQGRTAAGALEGIARNPGSAKFIQTPMILCLALIESLVLLAWVMGYLLHLRIG